MLIDGKMKKMIYWWQESAEKKKCKEKLKRHWKEKEDENTNLVKKKIKWLLVKKNPRKKSSLKIKRN